MSKKKLITEVLIKQVDFDGRTFTNFKYLLTEVEQKFSDYKNFRFDPDWDYDNNKYIDIIADRLETDEEYNTRIEHEKEIEKEKIRKIQQIEKNNKKRAIEKEENERKLYEQLKKKYEGK